MQVTLAGSTYPYKPSDEDLSGTSVELAAFDGEVGNGILIVRDPASSYNVSTGRQALIEEGSVVLSDGFMLDQDRTRGFTPAVAREYAFGLADANALLDGFRLNQRRPTETDYERVMFFAGANLPDADTTWVLNANTVSMPAKRYYGDGGWTAELIPDVVSYTGKTLFLHDLADGSGRCLHYHVLTTGHTCGLAISDVIADSLGSSTTFFPQEPQRTRTSIDLRNDIKGVDQSGRTSLASDATSIANHDADGLWHQAQLDVEATSQADLDQQTAAFLASQKDDLDTYLCTIGPLDETALGLIRVGDIITVTSVVMGLTASEKRISHMTLTPVIGEGSKSFVGLWMAALEMGAPIRRRARVSTSRPPIPDTEPFVCVQDIGVLSCEDGDGNIHSYTEGGTRSGLGYSFVGSNASSTSTDFVAYYLTGDSPGQFPAAGQTFNVGNGGMCCGNYTVGTFDYHTGGLPFHVIIWVIGAGTLTIKTAVHPGGQPGCFPSCGDPGDIVASAYVSTDSTFVTSDTQPAGTDLVVTIPDDDECAHFVDINSPTGPWGFGGANWTPNMSGIPCTNGEPTPGQAVHDPPFDGDGVTDSGTTLFGYEPGSLVLLVNGIDWSDLVTEDDPTAGTYSVAYPFPFGATIEVRYRSD